MKILPPSHTICIPKQSQTIITQTNHSAQTSSTNACMRIRTPASDEVSTMCKTHTAQQKEQCTIEIASVMYSQLDTDTLTKWLLKCWILACRDFWRNFGWFQKGLFVMIPLMIVGTFEALEGKSSFWTPKLLVVGPPFWWCFSAFVFGLGICALCKLETSKSPSISVLELSIF